jgi:large subunit ribosomal protein L4
MPTMDVVNLENTKTGSIDLSDEVWNAPPKRYLLSEVVHWQRAKRRRGTQSALTKAGVHGTTKKPFKQKGTGNARQGSNRNPHMIGGGVAFAPKPRDYSYTLPRAKRRAALAVALSLKVKEGGIRIVKDFDLDEIKTKKVTTALQSLGVDKALIVDSENENLSKSSRNISTSRYLHHSGINVYDLLKYPSLVITETAAKAIETKLLGTDSSES